MDAKTIIDSVASGKALEAKESLNSLLSARAFEALDAKKIELAQALFSTKDQIENEEEISKEEVEQIDELSKKTLGSYVSKATDSLSKNRFSLGSSIGATHEKGGADNRLDKFKSDPRLRKGENRSQGIKRAVSSLTK